jgi:hypothetical protein
MKCSSAREDEFIALGQDKTCFLRDRNVSEKIPQRRSWFCPAIGRALGLLSPGKGMALLPSPSPKNRACDFNRTRLKHFKRPLRRTRYSNQSFLRD